MRDSFRPLFSLLLVLLAVTLIAPLTTAATDIEIDSVSTPTSVRGGGMLNVTVTVRNAGTTTIDNVSITIDAFDQRTATSIGELDTDEADTTSIALEVPKDADGPEDITVTVRALDDDGDELDTDINTVSTDVRAFHLTMRVRPQQVVVGESVDVTGAMSERGATARIYVGGAYHTTVTANALKQYEYRFSPQESGTYRVEVVSNGVRRVGFVTAYPRMGVTDIRAPAAANTQDSFRTCADIFRSTRGLVTIRFLVDGAEQRTVERVIEGTEEQCFTASISTPGEHRVVVEAQSEGTTDSMSRTMNVVESRIEVSVFPPQLTLERGSAGTIEIHLENGDANARTFTIDVTGITDISELTDQQVVVASGEERTVYLRVTPNDRGTFTGTITVRSDGNTFADTDVAVLSADNPPLKNPRLAPLNERLQGIADYVRTYPYVFAALGIVFLGAVLFLVRARRSRVLEPQR